VSCAFSKETLALYVGDDLGEADARLAACHLASCAACRVFVEELQASQSRLRSLRLETVDRAACAGMRRAVMAAVESGAQRVGWWLRVERALLSHPSYALAACAIVSLVSVSVYAQMRLNPPARTTVAAVFDGGNVLERPQGYGNWVVAGATGSGQHTHGKVFIDPTAYREYSATGRFPQGTVMVWERAARPTGAEANAAPQLLVSVKDNARFDGGWGFYDFSGANGSVKATAAEAADANCRTCHRADAETDHVFTQQYPSLRAARLSTHT
jgi:hypothetical protein